MKASVIVVGLGTILISGCTHYRPLGMSAGTMGINQKAVGVTRGEAERNYFLGGLLDSGDDSLEAAVRNALSQSSVPAQGMINVFADRNCTYYLATLWWACRTTVFGTAIQYSDLGNARVSKKPELPDVPSNAVACKEEERIENGHCVTRVPGR